MNLGYPWCALGGFNAICNAKEKSGGRSCDRTIRICNSVVSLLTMVHIKFNLQTLHLHGVTINENKYTRIYEVLGRVIANSLWIKMFPKSLLHKGNVF